MAGALLSQATAVAAATPWPTLIAGGVALLLVGVVGLTIRAIVRGDLVPRRVLEDEKERADKWEQAWRTSEARMDALDGRLQAIAEASATSTQLLESLTHRARR